MNQIFGGIECKLYICHVIFFIVLDLRLTKVGVQPVSYTHLAVRFCQGEPAEPVAPRQTGSIAPCQGYVEQDGRTRFR